LRPQCERLGPGGLHQAICKTYGKLDTTILLKSADHYRLRKPQPFATRPCER